MNALRLISRVFVGIVFIFSGFVKAVDPLGSTYKFVDYFQAFGLDFFEPIAFPLSLLMSAAEFIIGVALLIGIRMKPASWAVLLFMGFFTPLTFILALTNPVTDCGCFGDALILTNWETFYKNLLIMAMTLVIFFERDKFKQLFCTKVEWFITGGFTLLIIAISMSGYMHLPIMDFRPYKVGTYIPEKMVFPEDAEPDQYETLLYYEKDGEVKEFTVSNMPDSTWKWVDTKNILVKTGYKPPIHDFVIESSEDGDITDVVLSDENYNFLLVSYDINKACKEGFKNIYPLAEYCKENNYAFKALTASSNNDVEELKDYLKAELNIEDTEAEEQFETFYYYEKDGETSMFTEDDLPDSTWTFVHQEEELMMDDNQNDGFAFEFFNSDEITLKTIVRANPGLVLLKGGTVIDKWHFNDVPSIEEFKKQYFTK